MKRMITVLVMAAVFVISARGQEFLNLNFESAYNLPGNPGYGASVSVTNALPNWIAYDGYTALADVNYSSNGFFGTSASVGLVGGSLALSGNFSVELYSGGSISQTGSVPSTAQSLQFEAEGPGPGGSLEPTGFSVTLGGDALSYSVVSEELNYTVYGANIPAGMAGQTEALDFQCLGVGSGNVVLDNIDFSPMSVPEPSECALIGLGAILFSLRFGWRQKTPKFWSAVFRRWKMDNKSAESAKSADKTLCRPVRG